MNVSRRVLLKQSFVATPLLTAALRQPTPILAADAGLRADPGQWYWFPGHTFCMKATGADTGGTAAFMLCENSPREGVPFHKHSREDESFYVVDGMFELTVGDNTATGGPGTYAFGPRGVPHRWTNIGTGRGRILLVLAPSGIEQLFYDIGVKISNSAAPPPGEPAPLIAKMETVPTKYGVTRTGDFKYPPSAPPHPA
jgi:quercetin dioxygenase-like cupin family protein